MNPRDVRHVKPKMWANVKNPERCPVIVYKQYALLRPANFCHTEDPFYIATSTKTVLQLGDQSFKRQPIGINKLTSLMRRMATAAGLPADKKLSNHSARKHLVQKLSEANVPPTHIMQITGHKNVQSINNYSHINELQHKHISSILSNSDTSMPLNENPSPSHPLVLQHQSNSLHSSNTSLSIQHASENTATKSSQSVQDCIKSMFSGNIYGGTFNINVNQTLSHSPVIPAKRRRDSDSD